MNTTINTTEFGSVVAGILVVGAILKNAFPNFQNRFIPLVTWLLGIIAYQITVNAWQSPQAWLAAVMAAATATGTHSALKNTLQGEPPTVPPFVPKLPLLLFICGGLAFFTGCARFNTTQTDASYENGVKVREVTTRATATTLFEARSALASFKATQTDKTQSASVGSLTQESASGTNTIQAAGEFIGSIVRAAAKP